MFKHHLIHTVKIVLITVLTLLFYTETRASETLAFPGAEGFGKYTSGGRGGVVLFVTNLNDDGLGSLRSAIETEGSRTIIFQISGNIRLQSPLHIEEGNLTIAGQTAPGDGICICDYPVIIKADNVILRFIRSRLGDRYELSEDAISATHCENLIVDHCSFSWGIDEVASFYDNVNTTVQWCIVSESLNDSYHHKGKHGYGGIWGGMGASFHHNLIAHNSSRNPRFMGSRYHKQPERELVDFRNNVIYNWGMNSSYGGEAGRHNLVANYYKSGPASKRKDRIVEPWDENGRWFISQNYVFDHPKIIADNWAGGVQGDYVDEIRADSVFAVEDVYTIKAEEAFELVLSNAGVVIPVRDTVDTRIVSEVRSGKASFGKDGRGIIDSQKQVGSWPELRSTKPLADRDMDGMPDQWEISTGLNPDNPKDSKGYSGTGYTYLEEYLNSLVIKSDDK